MFIVLWLTLAFISFLVMVHYSDTSVSKIFGKSKEIYKGIRLSHFLISIPLIAVIIVVGYFLYNLHPILQFGWLWSLVVDNKGVTPEGYTGFPFMDVLVACGLILFSLFVPYLAHIEELSYREPYIDKGWGQGVKGSLIFGLMHLIMGIPLAVALALSIGGVTFLYVAKKKGIMESTYLHSAYNLTVLTLIIAACWFEVVMYVAGVV